MSPSDGWAARCDGVAKTYAHATGRVHALRGVSMEVPAGKLTAVAGPSGSGKSTLLRLLAGLDRPTAGSVRVAGFESAGPYRLRRGVGYVFQRPSDNFVPYLTVAEHLELAPGHREGAGILDRLGISHTARRRPGELSGGEQQRAAVAQLLAGGTSLIVADEPTAELDSRSAKGLLEALRGLAERGTTFIIATHDPAVMSVAHRTIRLDHGSVATVTKGAPAPAVPSPAAPAGAPLGPPMARARAVAKSFREGSRRVEALRGVDVALHPGEVLGLVGRSGSGKTTLLNILAEWDHPDRGTVDWRPEARRGRPPPWDQVAIVPQRLGLLDDLTVRENIEHPARLAGRVGESREWADELIERLGLGPLEQRRPADTSVGEQQRTAVARALILDPALLLADEPTGHQDGSWGRAVFDMLRQAALRDVCCLIATHNRDAVAYCDRVLEIADGRIVPAAEGLVEPAGAWPMHGEGPRDRADGSGKDSPWRRP